MRVVFISDRSDSHALRFASGLAAYFVDFETIRVRSVPGRFVEATIEGASCRGWEQISGALDKPGSVVLTGPLDTVTSNLNLSHCHHIGISWASDIMVSAARNTSSFEAFQRTVLALNLVVTDNVACENVLLATGVSSERIIRFPWGPIDVGQETISRATLRLPDSGFLGLFCRSLEPHYQPLTFVKSLEILRERGLEATWAMINRGSLRQAVKKNLDIAGLASSVIWIPARSEEDFARTLPLFDAIVSIPKTDGTSVTVLQSMAARVPVITSATNGSAEWIVNGVTGWTCGLGDALALAESIEQLIGMPEKWRNLVTENAYQLVQEKAGWDKGFKRLVQAIGQSLSA